MSYLFFNNFCSLNTVKKLYIIKWTLVLSAIFVVNIFSSSQSFSAPRNNKKLNSQLKFKSVLPKFINIKAGSFLMGSPENEPTRYPPAEIQHPVTFTRDFEIQITEVTQMQWVSVMGYNPSQFKIQSICPEDYTEINGIPICPNHPVEMVSWNEIKTFFQKLNSKARSYLYRLPTEAEWEYAARGGQASAFSFGPNLSELDSHGWFDENANKTSHRVASKYPNPYGLYDVHGNIYEFVMDWWAFYPNAAPQVDPQGPPSGHDRVMRGGSWFSISHIARSAARNFVSPDERRPYLGFRMVRFHR